MAQTNSRRIEFYDTTLRDGAQAEGVAFSLVDKIKIAHQLDALGMDYIEGGYPLSNPKDEAFFKQIQRENLRQIRVCAFGMTRRRGISPDKDPGMKALVNAGAPVITIVGKTWDLHVDEVLKVDRDENLAMISQSLAFCHQHGHEVFFDAEHFFDGFAANSDYATASLQAALDGGATRLILCDTNGGSLPKWIGQVVDRVRNTFQDFDGLGIHTHNDCGLAVANSIVAIESGAHHVQGTINGLGERCGNVDLTTLAATLALKMNYNCLKPDTLPLLTETSRYIYELANMNPVHGQPFVGSSAFAHKGGMHVHAVQRVAHSYEQVDPAKVGNTRRFLISELSGASNISATLGKKFDIFDNKKIQRQLLERVQDLENRGYQFESATASLELLLHEILGTRPIFWQLDHYRCVILKRAGTPAVTEATVKLTANDQIEHRVAEGDGPVNALDAALRKCLTPHYPQVANVHLRDFKVRVVNPTAESAAKVCVCAEFAVIGHNGGGETKYFTTVGVDENIIDASWQALADAIAYYLIESQNKQ